MENLPGENRKEKEAEVGWSTVFFSLVINFEPNEKVQAKIFNEVRFYQSEFNETMFKKVTQNRDD